jgi:hypothetical protein
MSDRPTPPFAEALRLLDEYHRDLVARIAEELVEARDSFDASYTGTAEDLVNRYGYHLNCLGALRQHLLAGQYTAHGPGRLPGAPRGPVREPTGEPVGSDTPLEAGTRVLARWHGVWYEAEVVSVGPGDRVRIHYTGWGDQFDEAVPRHALRLKEPQEPPAGED